MWIKITDLSRYHDTYMSALFRSECSQGLEYRFLLISIVDFLNINLYLGVGALRIDNIDELPMPSVVYKMKWNLNEDGDIWYQKIVSNSSSFNWLSPTLNSRIIRETVIETKRARFTNLMKSLRVLSQDYVDLWNRIARLIERIVINQMGVEELSKYGTS